MRHILALLIAVLVTVPAFAQATWNAHQYGTYAATVYSQRPTSRDDTSGHVVFLLNHAKIGDKLLEIASEWIPVGTESRFLCEEWVFAGVQEDAMIFQVKDFTVWMDSTDPIDRGLINGFKSDSTGSYKWGVDLTSMCIPYTVSGTWPEGKMQVTGHQTLYIPLHADSGAPVTFSPSFIGGLGHLVLAFDASTNELSATFR